MEWTQADRDAADAELEAGFMVPSIVGPETWIEVDTQDGLTLVPAGFDVAEIVGDVEVYEKDEVTGYFARLSAPGYLDCTDWVGPFETEEDARQHLRETFADGC